MMSKGCYDGCDCKSCFINCTRRMEMNLTDVKFAMALSWTDVQLLMRAKKDDNDER